jgi:uncharacterized membrane protein
MNSYRRSVGLFYSRDEAERALLALRNDGFNMNRVNLIARDADDVTRSTGVDLGPDKDKNKDNNASEGAGAGATSGAVLGGIGGLLVGLGTLAIPGVGPIIVAGEAATTIATTLAGAGIGAAAGGIIGGLVGMGIPEDRAKIYSDRVSSGSYLIMVNGSNSDIMQAERILHNNGIEEYGVYDAPDIDDNIYNRSSVSNRTDNIGNVNRSEVVEPNLNTQDKMMADRPQTTEPMTRSDRLDERDVDVIIVEPRDNV